jgi:phenylacetate-CoA ligase
VIALLPRACLLALSLVHRLLHVSGVCATLLALPGFEAPRWQLGRLGVWIRFHSALRRVPAYREFIAAQLCAAPLALRKLAQIPSMDKRNYVNAYSLASRCSGGSLPTKGLLIDESSGTTGMPTNWVRGRRERAANGRMLKFAVRRRLGTDPLFFINTFALGPWATGVNLTLTLARWARIKALGPDLAKVINALKTFGPEHHYVILGYPPFLKQLLDSREIDWASYRVSLIFGGEGMGESMRRYLLQRGAGRVFGSYGASDLEINIAAETDFTIALRRLLEVRPELARRFVRHAGAIPMIFQFNPAEFFIESNADGELLITICRPDYVTPKVRYNIHDVGHVMRFPELRRLLAAAGVNTGDLDPQALDLPVLFHYGRSDLSVAWFGCKIPPSDVQETLFRLPSMAAAADAFQLRTFEDPDGDKRLVVDLEVPAGSLLEGADYWTVPFFDHLAMVNQDFRESRRMVTAGKGPRLEFHDVGSGPFASADIRIKRSYVSREQVGAGAH